MAGKKFIEKLCNMKREIRNQEKMIDKNYKDIAYYENKVEYYTSGIEKIDIMRYIAKSTVRTGLIALDQCVRQCGKKKVKEYNDLINETKKIFPKFIDCAI